MENDLKLTTPNTACYLFVHREAFKFPNLTHGNKSDKEFKKKRGKSLNQ